MVNLSLSFVNLLFCESPGSPIRTESKTVRVFLAANYNKPDKMVLLLEFESRTSTI